MKLNPCPRAETPGPKRPIDREKGKPAVRGAQEISRFFETPYSVRAIRIVSFNSPGIPFVSIQLNGESRSDILLTPAISFPTATAFGGRP
jgi:hypothetical protein